MSGTFDSRLELVVLEGGGKGSRHYLDRPRLTLGRKDEGEEPEPGVVAFPEPTVSRVHALLEWDPARHRYLLVHRSRTNPTVLNGVQVLDREYVKAGDRIKLGNLVLEVRRVAPQEAAPAQALPERVETGLFLVALTGPARGALHPLNYSRLVLKEPGSEPDPRPGIFLAGLGPLEAFLIYRPDLPGQFLVECPSGPRPVLVHAERGQIHLWVVGPREPLELGRDTLLVAGQVVLWPCGLERAGEVSEAVKEGRAGIHPLLESLRPGQEDLWAGPEVHRLRVLSGPEQGSTVWLRPDELAGPVTLGPRHARPLPQVHLPDRQAPSVELDLEKGRFILRNTDPEKTVVVNWDEVTPEEEVPLVSGDRFRLGSTVILYEYLPVQRELEMVQARCGDLVFPLPRQVCDVGYSTDCDVRIDNRALAPRHGQLIFREGRFFYKQRSSGWARLGERVVRQGEEVPLNPGEPLSLMDVVELVLERRETPYRSGQAVLI
ncbi:MAG TPA: FHA domain-containing protein [Candidatus Nitrosotenuis sp.]|jgi:pSer/pThr/pTyr-binding forkhead associated (FHA) protein|nr:FHA domain-containing protein [Candidatus Nitrosotenuis sp.]